MYTRAHSFGDIAIQRTSPTNIFGNTVTPIVISPDTTDTFKTRLDKFWKHQDILYDYKVELTGVWSRSQINANDTL